MKEKLEHNLNSKSEVRDHETAITESLGNANCLLSSLQQMQHFLNYMSGSVSNDLRGFLLEDEIDYILEGLAVNLQPEETLKYCHDDRLPDLVAGEVNQLRLFLNILVEFGIKQSKNVELRTTHLGVEQTDRNITKIGFVLTIDALQQYEALMLQVLNTKSTLIKRFLLCKDFIDDLGFGMIILPGVIQALNGSLGCKTVAGQFKISVMVPLMQMQEETMGPI